jgi:hypothetical protein
VLITIGRGSRPLRYQRRHRHQDKFGAQISGRFDAPLVELTDIARSAPPCRGGLRLELSYRTSTLTLDPVSGEAVRWSMPLHLMNIADAPDSWRRRRTLESVSFVEASQLRSFDYLSANRVLRGGAEHPSPERRRRATESFEAEQGIRVLRGGAERPSPSRRSRAFRDLRGGAEGGRTRPFGGGEPEQFVCPVCNSGSCPLCYGAPCTIRGDGAEGEQFAIQMLLPGLSVVVNRIDRMSKRSILSCITVASQEAFCLLHQACSVNQCVEFQGLLKWTGILLAH